MTNSSEREPISSEHIERITGLRYNLSNSRIGSEDIFKGHVSGRVRLITYPMPREHGKVVIRATLQAEGLIVGKPLSEKLHGKQVFAVPQSARPITYDASSHAEGAFSYGDDRLFYDLGFLLGTAQSMGFVLHEEIAHSVALVEFSRPEDRQLFFVPGIECVMDFNTDGEDHSGYYVDSLRQEFGDRFTDAGIYFRMGFGEAAVTDANRGQ